MRVLIACEYSGIVREAFKAKGWDAWSCDLLDTEIDGQHYKGNVMDIINDNWDLMVAHPPCTYIANSGVRWLGEKYSERRRLLVRAVIFFKRLLNAPIEHIVIENPVPHKYAALPKYTQIIQPWMFGHGETKATCLWLKNLPKLTHSKTDTLFEKKTVVEGREHRIHRMPPGPDRAKLRSKTFPGFAEAMATQWTNYLLTK